MGIEKIIENVSVKKVSALVLIFSLRKLKTSVKSYRTFYQKTC